MKLHENEIRIDLPLVRQLVAAQFPEFRHLPIAELGATGSTNKQYRLGDELLVRLPRQPRGGAGIMKEARWTAEIGKHLSVAVPEILAVGQPGDGFGEVWSIVRYLPGEIPTPWQADERPREPLARRLADVIRTLRDVPISDEAGSDERLRPYRGESLARYDAQFRRTLATCAAIEGLALDLEAAARIWDDALSLPGARQRSARWFHSDLVAENLLTQDGVLTGVLDFGGLGIGDPTIDLHGAWELFDPKSRAVFREQVGAAEDEWIRARAWAIAVPLMTFDYYWDTMPARVTNRLAMARAAVADADARE